MLTQFECMIWECGTPIFDEKFNFRGCTSRGYHSTNQQIKMAICEEKNALAFWNTTAFLSAICGFVMQLVNEQWFANVRAVDDGW